MAQKIVLPKIKQLRLFAPWGANCFEGDRLGTREHLPTCVVVKCVGPNRWHRRDSAIRLGTLQAADAFIFRTKTEKPLGLAAGHANVNFMALTDRQ